MANKMNVLISAADIQTRIGQLALSIERDYEGRDITFICVLKGSLLFTADLCRAITRDVRLTFISLSSYGDGTESTGKVRIDMDLDTSIEGRDVIVVEDIVDTGLTIAHLIKRLEAQNPASVKICALLDKPSRRREGDIEIDYVGFTVPDMFVVGFGMDYAQRYRNLPYIAVVTEDAQ